MVLPIKKLGRDLRFGNLSLAYDFIKILDNKKNNILRREKMK